MTRSASARTNAIGRSPWASWTPSVARVAVGVLAATPAVAAIQIAARTTVAAPHVVTMVALVAIRVDATATAEATATTSRPILV